MARTHAERLIAQRDALADEIENEQERRAALTAAGHPAPVTYSIGGVSVSYDAWLEAKLRAQQMLTDQINAEVIPYGEIRAW